MREPCTNLNYLSNTDDPFVSKWQNCEYDGEPQEINDPEMVDEFKKLCPSMYNGDDRQRVCCSANQIRILKKSIQEAEKIIGTCPSCYFNFRNFWCQITCNPEQDKFVIPVETYRREFRNFTEQLNRHLIEKQKVNSEDDEEAHDEETNEHDEKNKIMYNVVSTINVYMQREFLENLISSCHDIKLYSSDALQGFCGVPSKQCTPEQYTYHMGLVVDQNPFKVHFIINQTDEKVVPIKQLRLDENNNIIKAETNDFHTRPILPKYFKCNESFQFGDLDYGSKCSCKVSTIVLYETKILFEEILSLILN